MMLRMRLAALAALLLLGLGVPSVAAAQNKEAAKAAYRRGTQHFNLNELQPALDSFKEAYRQFEDPTILFNIGQCQRALGQTDDAIHSFRAYLNGAKNAPNREEVRTLLDKLAEQSKMQRAQREERERAQAESAARERAAVEAEAAAAVGKNVVESRPLVTEPPERKRIRPWMWGAIAGGVVVVGLAVGLGVAFGLPPSNPKPSEGAITFMKTGAQ